MNELIIELVAKIVGMLLVTAIGVAGTWLTAKIAKRNELANIAAATDEAVGAAQRVVLELQQTVVEGMKASCEDGKLSDSEIEALIREMLETGAPPTCPHGRPVVKALSRRDLEKMFKRIQ